MWSLQLSVWDAWRTSAVSDPLTAHVWIIALAICPEVTRDEWHPRWLRPSDRRRLDIEQTQKISDRILIDVDRKVFATWDVSLTILMLLIHISKLVMILSKLISKFANSILWTYDKSKKYRCLASQKASYAVDVILSTCIQRRLQRQHFRDFRFAALLE